MKNNFEIDKSLILNKIQDFLGFEKDVEFAKHLGISPQVLSNWKSRGTFKTELLYEKCDTVNPMFILTGKEPVSFDEHTFLVGWEGYDELTEEQDKAWRANTELWDEFIDECFRRKKLNEPFPYGNGVTPSGNHNLIEAKDKLIASYEERISELKEYIELIKEKVNK